MSSLKMEKETEKIKFIGELLKQILLHLGVSGSVTVVRMGDRLRVEISSEDTGLLIGYHGEVLDSLQVFLNLAVYNQFQEWVPLTVDAGGYRREREEKLKDLAQRAVDKVRFLSKPVSLPPMPSHERRIVHLVVSVQPDVSSESVGEGRERHVTVRLKKEEEVG